MSCLKVIASRVGIRFELTNTASVPEVTSVPNFAEGVQLV
jgi:hypothetical protein